MERYSDGKGMIRLLLTIPEYERERMLKGWVLKDGNDRYFFPQMSGGGEDLNGKAMEFCKRVATFVRQGPHGAGKIEVEFSPLQNVYNGMTIKPEASGLMEPMLIGIS